MPQSEVSTHSLETSHLTLTSVHAPKQSDDYIMVNIGEIKPSFAEDVSNDVSDFLQDAPELDLFTSEHSTDIVTAMKIIEDKVA